MIPALLLAANRLLGRLIRKRRFAQKDTNKAALALYRRCLCLLKGLGESPDAVPQAFYDLAVKARFSQHIIKPEELSPLAAYVKTLEASADLNFPFWKRLLWRYLLGRL